MTTADDQPLPDNSRDHQVLAPKRDASGRFRKGASGNPHGPPRGSRHWATRMAEALIDGEGDQIVRKTIELALGGDIYALRICMDRLLPPRKDRPVRFDLPRIADAAGLLQAHACVLQAAADGELSPDEAGEISALMKQHRDMLVLVEITDRIAEIERLLAGEDRPAKSNEDRDHE